MPKTTVKTVVFEPHGILKPIYRIYRIPRKRNIWCRTDPGFPTPGVRMTVVYTNSLKLAKPHMREIISDVVVRGFAADSTWSSHPRPVEYYQ